MADRYPRADDSDADPGEQDFFNSSARRPVVNASDFEEGSPDIPDDPMDSAGTHYQEYDENEDEDDPDYHVDEDEEEDDEFHGRILLENDFGLSPLINISRCRGRSGV